MPSILLFPRFDTGLGTLTDEHTAVSRILDLPARMPMPADEVDPTAAEPEVPATPR